MSNSYIDTTLLDKAIIFAVNAHANTERRGKGFPYVVHPMEAVVIVATMTSDQEILAAAALHDTVEDTEVTIEQIREMFGERIASLVADESEKREQGMDEKASWRGRKEAAIAHLKNASLEAKMVALGDKLSNIRAIYQDYIEIGDLLWDRFHAPNGKPDHEWHYRGLAEALSDLSNTIAYKEFARLVDEVFGQGKAEILDLSEYEQSGAGFTSLTYNHKDGKRMVKFYSDFIPSTLPPRELKVSAAIQEMGLRIPKAYRLVTDGSRLGVEFERISPKRSYARSIADEPERLEEFAVEFSKMVKELHQTPCNTEVFSDAKLFFREVVGKTTHFKETQKAKMLAFIDSVPDATTCLHGDLHVGNLITNGKENYWIDLADFRYGNPLFDMGMMHFTCNCCPDSMTFELYHFHNEEMERVWRIFVREYFGANNDEDLKKVNEMTAPFAALMIVHFSNRGNIFPFMKDFVNAVFPE